MADSYDGEIKLKVSLNAKDTKQASDELRKHFTDIFKAVEGKEVDSTFKRLQKSMADTMYNADQLTKRITDLGNTKIPTEQYKYLQEALDESTKDAIKLRAKLESLKGKRGRGKSAEIEELKSELQYAEQYATNLRGRMDELKSQGKAFTFGSDTQEYKDLIAQSASLNNQMRVQAEQAHEQMDRLGISIDSDTSRYSEFMARFHEGTVTIASRLAPVIERFRNIGQAILLATRRMLQFGASIVKAGISKLKTTLSRATHHSNGFNFSMKKGLMTILKYGFGIRSLYFLFRKLRSAMGEAFKLMAQKVPEVNKQLSTMKSSFQTFKNSLATAFQPLLNVVVPIVTKIMTVLTAATTKVGEFFAALTGQKYIYKATQANLDYADSLDKSKKAADKALGSYDKLEVISKDNADDTSGASNAAMGGFEKVPVSEQVQDFMKRLKEAWQNGADFTWLGELLGTKLRDALNNIDWNPIKENAQKVAIALGTFINGFIKTEGLAESIGHTLGEAINTGVLAINTFIKTTDWLAVGEFIGQGIQSAIDTIDWEAIGETFSNGLNAVFSAIQGLANKIDGVDIGNKISTMINKAITGFDAKAAGKAVSDFALDLLNLLNTALQNTDWQAAGQKVADGIKSIKWSELISKAFESIGSLSGAVAGFAAGLFSDLIDSIKKYFAAHIAESKENGESIVRGILLGIAEGLVNIGQWIVDNIFKPFIKGFKEAFGIASPSKEMETMGGYITDGLYQGILTALGNVQKWITDHVLTPIKNAFGTVKNGVIDFAINVKEATGSKLTSILKAWEVFKGKAKTQTLTLKTKVKGYSQKVWDSIKNNWSTLTKIKGEVKNIAVNATTNGAEKLKTLADAWEKLKNAVKSKINPKVTVAITGGEKLLDKILNVWNSIKDKTVKFKLNIDTALLNAKTFVNENIIKPINKKLADSKIPIISKWSIPTLAQGAVIPPNSEFMAVLGDQKQGTNIETPLHTMIDAFKTALRDMGGTGSNNQTIVLQLAGKTVAECVWDEEEKRYKQTGQYKRYRQPGQYIAPQGT